MIELKGFRDLKVYKLAFELALRIYEVSKSFPKEEKYSLTDQIRRSSRSVAANIAEAWSKRMYPKHFVSKLTDADGEALETTVWLEFSYSHSYIEKDAYQELMGKYQELGRMMGSMILRPEKFTINTKT